LDNLEKYVSDGRIAPEGTNESFELLPIVKQVIKFNELSPQLGIELVDNKNNDPHKNREE
jgi:hypothetical protein